MADRRYGRFTAPADWVSQFSTALKRVMGQCIVFRAEQLFHADHIEYWAASEHFRPVAPGEVIPEYRWVFVDGHPHAEEVTYDTNPSDDAKALSDAVNEIDRQKRLLEAIGDYAHDHSTGPAVPDALWEVRRMAYEGARAVAGVATDQPTNGGE